MINPRLHRSYPHRTLPSILPRVVAGLTALLLTGCAINPRPAFDETASRVRSRTGLDASWMRSEAEEAAVLVKVREILKEPMSPRNAARIALLNNRALQAKLEELGIAQAQVGAAGLPGNPEIEGFLGWPSERGESKKIDLGFGLDVLDLLVLPSRKRLAALELEQTKALAGDEILRTAREAQAATYALQGAQARLSGVSLAFDIESALSEFADARHAAGNLSALDREEEKGRLDELRTRRKLLELEVRSRREEINRLLSLWDDLTEWSLEPLQNELPAWDPERDGLEALALDQRFDIAATRAAIDLLESALKLQKRTRLLPAGIAVGARTEKEGTVRVTGPSLRLQLPIFNPGRAETSRLQAMYLQAQRLFEDGSVRARAEVREKREELAAYRGLVRDLEEEVAPRRRRIVDMSRARYNMMLKGADDLLRARLEEVESEIHLAEARTSYWIARTDLALALGGRIPENGEGENR